MKNFIFKYLLVLLTYGSLFAPPPTDYNCLRLVHALAGCSQASIDDETTTLNNITPDQFFSALDKVKRGPNWYDWLFARGYSDHELADIKLTFCEELKIQVTNSCFRNAHHEYDKTWHPPLSLWMPSTEDSAAALNETMSKIRKFYEYNNDPILAEYLRIGANLYTKKFNCSVFPPRTFRESYWFDIVASICGLCILFTTLVFGPKVCDAAYKRYRKRQRLELRRKRAARRALVEDKE